MSSYMLGADETKPAPIFVRLVAPTDIQEVTDAMDTYFKTTYKSPLGLPWLNLKLWHLIGSADASGSPVLLFLTRLIDWEKLNQKSVNSSSASEFTSAMISIYKYPVDDINEYVRVYLAVLAGGSIPMTIQQPWDYKPTSVLSDVAAAAGQAIGTGIGSGAKAAADQGLNVPMLLLGAIAVYAGVTVFLPKMLVSKASGK